MNYLLALAALAAGALIALQFGVNAAWRSAVGANPLFATLASYAGGTLTALACLLLTRPEMPAADRVAGAPWWTWLGGTIGVGYVTASVLLAPRLGATALIVLVVAGQVLASVAFDHFGLAGYPVHPVNLGRLAACALLVGAVLLIQIS